jgi:hypothetical protein
MGKSSKPTIGYWYRVALHHGLTTEIDAFLEMRGGSKTAWQGELTASGTLSINAPNLWGGEKDQGGIVGNLAVMFGEPTQVPNPYLVVGLRKPDRGMARLRHGRVRRRPLRRDESLPAAGELQDPAHPAGVGWGHVLVSGRRPGDPRQRDRCRLQRLLEVQSRAFRKHRGLLGDGL